MSYATNIHVDMVSAEEIHEIYSLRWQVEIFFKYGSRFLKSTFQNLLRLRDSTVIYIVSL